MSQMIKNDEVFSPSELRSRPCVLCDTALPFLLTLKSLINRPQTFPIQQVRLKMQDLNILREGWPGHAEVTPFLPFLRFRIHLVLTC